MPFFHFNEQRNILEKWAQQINEQNLLKYCEDRNRENVDGKLPNIVATHNGTKAPA